MAKEEVIIFRENADVVNIIKTFAMQVGGVSEFYRIINSYILKFSQYLSAETIINLKTLDSYYGTAEFVERLDAVIGKMVRELPASSIDGEIRELFNECEGYEPQPWNVNKSIRRRKG